MSDPRPKRGSRRGRRWAKLAALGLLLGLGIPGDGPMQAQSQPQPTAEHPPLAQFLELLSPDKATAKRAETQLANAWRDGYAAMIIDFVRLLPPPKARRSGGGFEASSTESSGGRLGDDDVSVDDAGPAGGGAARGVSPLWRRLIRFLERQTGQKHGDNLDAWRRWIWSQPYDPHPHYATFKSGVYGTVDPAMRRFFEPTPQATIRLDKIDWGGVGVNGIPPLVYPKHVPVAEAGYLRDKHVVFGVMIGGQARAYPKRILAWHELARDRLGDVELALVYCTLCGTVIPYDATVDGVTYTFGTSGLLYKSNKLMFDEQTASLWSSVYGKPVVGPAVGRDLQLTRYPVVTTTWGEWREMHPQTTVLAPDTGFQRDYREGAAYANYFSHDRLMFAVDQTDGRLKNKDEVLVLAPSPTAATPLAVAAKFLERKPVFHITHEDRKLVILTTPRGANRVYEAGDTRFERWVDAHHVKDDRGGRWKVTEEALLGVESDATHRRLPAHRAFWFGWYAQFPETRLIR